MGGSLPPAILAYHLSNSIRQFSRVLTGTTIKIVSTGVLARSECDVAII